MWPGLVGIEGKQGDGAVKQRKTDRRSQRTYQLVSAAFTELLLEKPYDAILVQDILDRAGIGRTTFYAHYFDKEDLLNSMAEQMLEMFSRHITYSTARQRIAPSLELFEHAYRSSEQHYQQMRALMRSHASEPLWDTLQTALCSIIEPALAARCSDKRALPVPLSVLAQYLAITLLTLLKWWVSTDMSYSPEQLESIFQRLAMPGVWAILEEK